MHGRFSVVPLEENRSIVVFLQIPKFNPLRDRFFWTLHALSGEERQLRFPLLFLKSVHVGEYTVVVLFDAPAGAFSAEERHKLFVPGAGQDVSIPVDPGVFFFQPWKKAVQLRVIILPVSLAERQPHAEADHAGDLRFNAVIKHGRDVLFRVVDEGQDGAEPDHRGNSRVPQGLERFEPLPSGADARFYFFAQFLAGGG